MRQLGKTGSKSVPFPARALR